MPNTIQPINPLQNGQMINSSQDKPPQPKPAEKPVERPEQALNDRSERAEAHNAPSPKKVDNQKVEENQPGENPVAENPNPQETQNNQTNKQRGITLDIMT